MKLAVVSSLGALLLFLFGPHILTAGANPWIEVETPEFKIETNAPEKQALALAFQFERARAVFQKAFPGMRLYPRIPVVILAAADGPTYSSLEPTIWLQKGAGERTGMLYRGSDKDYILILLNSGGAHPYRVVYHEFSHLVLEDNYRSIPLWLNEGLAQFYSAMRFSGLTVRMGLPSREAISVLRSYGMIPLSTLFAVSYSSPYYTQESPATLFYAESWALTDFLMFEKGASGRGPIDRYLARTAEGEDAVLAAVKSFGNLDELQQSLQEFVLNQRFHYYRLNVPMRRDEGSFTVKKLSLADSEATRGDFLVRVGRLSEARTLLARAVAADPSPSEADESMGLLDLREGDVSRAQSWFALAARRCPQCYLARFYHALALMRTSSAALHATEIRDDFQAFIHFNPVYAPPYAALAEFDATQGGNTQAVLRLADKAVQLDPDNVEFLILEGNVLLKMGNFAEAERVARSALEKARTPRAKALADVFKGTLQEAERASGWPLPGTSR